MRIPSDENSYFNQTEALEKVSLSQSKKTQGKIKFLSTFIKKIFARMRLSVSATFTASTKLNPHMLYLNNKIQKLWDKIRNKNKTGLSHVINDRKENIAKEQGYMTQNLMVPDDREEDFNEDEWNVMAK